MQDCVRTNIECRVSRAGWRVQVRAQGGEWGSGSGEWGHWKNGLETTILTTTEHPQEELVHVMLEAITSSICNEDVDYQVGCAKC